MADRYQRLRESLEDTLRARLGAWAGNRLSSSLLLGSDFSMLILRLVADPRVSASDKGSLLGGLRSSLQAGGPTQMGARLAHALHFTFNKLDPCVVADNWPGDPDVLAWAQRTARRAAGIATHGLRSELERALLRPGALLRHLPSNGLVNALYKLRGIAPPRRAAPVAPRRQGILGWLGQGG